MKRTNKILGIMSVIIILILIITNAFLFKMLITQEEYQEQVYIIGTTWACYDGCYNMLEVLYEKPFNKTVKEDLYNPCINTCNNQYLENLTMN